MSRTAFAWVFGFAVWVLAGSGAWAQTDLTSERPPGDGPTRVEITFYFIDIMKVIDVDEAFEADLFILASWKDPRQAGGQVRVVSTETIWMPNLIIFNERSVTHTLPEEVTVQPDGTVVYRQRIIGTFASPLSLQRFPTDSQTLQVRLIVYGSSTDEVILVESATLPSSQNPDLGITDWEVGPLRAEAGQFQTMPGAPLLSTLAVQMDAERLVGYYTVQMLIPLLLIIGMSWIVFWIDPSIIPTRISLCVTTVLTLIAYRFMVGGLVPKLPYLTLVDYVLLGATLLVAASLVTVTASSALVGDRPDLVKRIERTARVVHPAAFAVILLMIQFLV